MAPAIGVAELRRVRSIIRCDVASRECAEQLLLADPGAPRLPGVEGAQAVGEAVAEPLGQPREDDEGILREAGESGAGAGLEGFSFGGRLRGDPARGQSRRPGDQCG